jgi:aspartate aminotransferase
MGISERALKASPSATLAISAKARQLKAQGVDVIGFGAGEPDFDTPQNIKDAAIKALLEGDTKYGARSAKALNEAICKKLREDNGLEYSPSQILVSSGAKHSLYNAILTLCDPGDEVIIPSPYWVSYPEMVMLAGGVPVYIPTDESTGFRMTPDQLRSAVTPKTKLLILNSPSNPTGAVYAPSEIEEFAKIAVEFGFYVISDEIYEKMVYDGNQQVSIASFGDDIKKLTVVVNGFSKTYSMTGWRIGYAAAEREIIDGMAKIQDHSTSNPTSFALAGALEALTGPQDSVQMMMHEFARRRKIMVEGLNAIPGIVCPEPGGAFYAFPNVSSFYGKSYNGKPINGSDSFAEFLLEEAKVAVVPGSGFGADGNIRLSYAVSVEDIKKGIERIGDAVSKLK